MLAVIAPQLRQKNVFLFFAGMKIAVDLRNTYNNDPALGVFTRECWQDMAALKPDHTFIFLQARKGPFFPGPKNVVIRTVKYAGIGWYDRWKLHQTLRRLKADRVINILQTGFRISWLFHNKNKKIAGEADRLVLFEPNGAAYMQKNKTVPPVTVIKPAYRSGAGDLSWTAAESIKTQFTGGRSFFLFTGNIAAQHQLIELLKAFSIFKKWQQSNMQLVIAGYSSAWTEMLEEKLQQYKFRADIVLLKDPAGGIIEQLVAACYAVLLPISENIFCPSLLLAVQSGKALIASSQPVSHAVIAAAEWVDKNDTAEGFAKAMILLYKDEKHLQRLEYQSRQEAMQLNRGQMLYAVWGCIEK
jgi:glycosyltransferase involved in cell wall biosynthesis